MGGPILVEDDISFPTEERIIDPTMAQCCQREMEQNVQMAAVKRALQRHDVVAERERRRRNLVQDVTTGQSGCRCWYDPRMDKNEDYSALAQLRYLRNQQKQPPQLTYDHPIATSLREQGEDAAESIFCVSIQGSEEKQDRSANEQQQEEDEEDEFDYLLDEDLSESNEELHLIEERRRAELEMEMLQREVELQHGFGIHRPMHPSRSLKAAGLFSTGNSNRHAAPPAVVVHLFDADSIWSASLDLYLEELATRMRGTQFIRSEGRSTLKLEANLIQAVLPRLRVNDLPLLIAIRQGVVIQTSPMSKFAATHHNDRKHHNYRDIHNNDVDETSTTRIDDDGGILTETVFDWLHQIGVLAECPPPLESLCRIRPEEEALLDSMTRHGKQQSQRHQEEFFRCGIAGCEKTFAHQHVGIETTEQSGLVVSEGEILGTL